ncbi:MAG: flagellar motor switch protein FliM [Desulfobacterales bacterium]|nr:MAG: flagellar motor switch protein FliM [Desulfobacterales bacterium]
MVDQILTQEEIDALLSAMNKGDVDLNEQNKEKTEAVFYSLTTQNIILRDQFCALEEVYDKFSTLMNQMLSFTLQRTVEVEFVSAKMVKYQQFIGEFSSPTSFQIFTMHPLIGSALLAIEPILVFSLIDCMFGGDGKPTTTVRDFTLIEERIIKKITHEILSKLEEAWDTVYRIKLSLKKTETRPEYVHLLAPDDSIIDIVFSIKAEGFTGNMHLGISYLTLEPIKEKLSAKYLQKKDMERRWDSQLQKLLHDTPVTLIAELGRTTKTVRHLLDLHINDIIKLDKGPEDLITISVDHVPKFMGYPGIIKGNRAVEIARLF